MFAKIARPSSTAATIVAKLSSASTMSAASFDTSVPVMPIATPMSAVLSAGASFTPSPVIATIAPPRCSASTIRSLCSGIHARVHRHLARPFARARRRPVARAPRRSRRGRRVAMPSSRAMTAAVRGWSPVIMIGRMPAPFARATASVASARGGSIMPIRPGEDEVLLDALVDAAVVRVGASSASQRIATPSVRSASSGERLVGARDLRAALRRQRPRLLADQLARAPREQHVGRALREHDAGAPSRSASRCTVLISLRSDENGTSPTRGSRASSASALRPALRAATSSAPSVGIALHRPAAVLLAARVGVVRAVGGGERALELDARARRRRRRRPRAARPRPARSPIPPKVDAPARRDDHAHGHLVLRQRARLVGRDHARRAERLDGGEVPHDRVAPRHALHADRRAPP